MDRRPAGTKANQVDAGGGVANRRSGRKTSFTGRAAVLAVVVAALAIALAGPLRALISQRSQVASVRQDVATTTRQLKDLQAKDKRWNDPAYVAAQARDRLHYVQPGQVPYVTLTATPSPPAAAAARSAPDEPWYAQLWSSVRGADATPKVSPQPARLPSSSVSSSPSPLPSPSASSGKPGT